MTGAEVIDLLWKTGHFKNPAKPEALSAAEADLPRLRVDDKAVNEAIESYQEFFEAALDELTLKHHRRPSQADGLLGPATAELLVAPRCGVPEYSGTASANWPSECRNELRTAYAMRLPGVSDGELQGLWREALRNWNGALADTTLDHVTTPDPLKVEVYATGKSLPGSTLAWSMLARNRCDVTLMQAYDTSINWKGSQLVTTITHELGHALGMNHVGDPTATLYPAINQASMSRRGFPIESDFRELRNIGYTIAATPRPEDPDGPGDPDPPDIPTGQQIFISVDGRQYVGIPKPEV